MGSLGNPDSRPAHLHGGRDHLQQGPPRSRRCRPRRREDTRVAQGGAYRIYAIALIILSGIASLGASLQVVEKSKGSMLSISQDEIRSSAAYTAKEGELASIDSEIEALVSRLKVLPPDFTTATAQTESSLVALRDRKQGILGSLATEEPIGASHSDGNMVALLGELLDFALKSSYSSYCFSSLPQLK